MWFFPKTWSRKLTRWWAAASAVRFISQAAEKELMRLRQIKALDAAIGCWKDEDHPELKQGSAKWVRKLRQESEKRFRRVTAR